jgi:hypothetical protein
LRFALRLSFLSSLLRQPTLGRANSRRRSKTCPRIAPSSEICQTNRPALVRRVPASVNDEPDEF